MTEVNNSNSNSNIKINSNSDITRSDVVGSPSLINAPLSKIPQALLVGLASSDRIGILKKEKELAKTVSVMRRRKKKDGESMPSYIDIGSDGLSSFQRLQIYKLSLLFGLKGGEGGRLEEEETRDYPTTLSPLHYEEDQNPKEAHDRLQTGGDYGGIREEE
eukprot:CAMPEP_0118653626 /NCGR_PEP_ID=MMETSP0785-20121206/11927_1 /TAXON_ID=91992 /ORGANISM="Bolidomonas pacifica, Strain CCMP 1866" /LENGTH=160 /DNA_ID=CAMNT_0006546173 /DNA_START=107 /DNA_END=587 /DNA_ORIENTATION=+